MSQDRALTGQEFELRPESRKRADRPKGLEWALVVLAILYPVALAAGPLFAIVWGALSSGFGAMMRQLTSPEAVNALKLTLLLSFAATALNTVFGLVVAMVLTRDDFKGRRVLNGLIDLPFAFSPVIAGFTLILLFGRNGWFVNLIDALNLRVVFALPGMLMATTFISLPFVARAVAPVLRHVGREQENVAYTMGAAYWRTFWSVTLPNIRWGLLYGVSLTFARAVGEFGAVLVVGGGVTRFTETATLYIYRSLDDRNEVGAYAMVLALAVISICLLWLMEYARKHAQDE
ncbi:MAG TPA: sulfate ABC transporter permease subunit [Blastocatellia bacterium]|nr:sulfate ABC transporter permease subunit [Blastocatellia bacterium]